MSNVWEKNIETDKERLVTPIDDGFVIAMKLHDGGEEPIKALVSGKGKVEEALGEMTVEIRLMDLERVIHMANAARESEMEAKGTYMTLGDHLNGYAMKTLFNYMKEKNG